MQWSITLSIDFTPFVPTLRVLHPTHLTELHIEFGVVSSVTTSVVENTPSEADKMHLKLVCQKVFSKITYKVFNLNPNLVFFFPDLKTILM